MCLSQLIGIIQCIITKISQLIGVLYNICKGVVQTSDNSFIHVKKDELLVSRLLDKKNRIIHCNI